LPIFEVFVGPEKYFPSGLNGYPTQASQTKVQKLNEYVIEQLIKLVDELRG